MLAEVRFSTISPKRLLSYHFSLFICGGDKGGEAVLLLAAVVRLLLTIFFIHLSQIYAVWRKKERERRCFVSSDERVAFCSGCSSLSLHS